MTYTNRNSYSTNKLRIAYCGTDLMDGIYENLNHKFQIFSSENDSQFNEYLTEQSLSTLPEIILIEADEQGHCFEVIASIRKNPLLKGLIIVLLASKATNSLKQKARALKIHDFYVQPFSYEELAERLDFLVRFKLIKPNLTNLSEKVTTTYKMPLNKRAFDLVFSVSCILFLLPLFIIVAGLIAIESDGRIIYRSKRVGTGYQVFNFYKFRSMRSDADKQLTNFNNLNQYTDGYGAGKSTFVKLKNDPRVTRIGAFLRKTSIDELPQLFNILKGDMSVVGNRPLPLYEAEQLTSNEWATRFLGPAGLTGLWQISRRGHKDMSERERKKLDNFYSRHYSFWFDLKIIFGTFPALLQKEKV
ncbi:sugar transferase [Mucilaginibacter arboris]|uniref:Sugar transferase n=1 Tax=Mucilaginibacter arboris TaxID=2682090 RepID=A0A7K1T0A4_9SPHI|nr:sugar transferase [Mucilaginibacter arboris]MVN22947.1 sugar transferase [Mucilaginibacter arboris]